MHMRKASSRSSLANGRLPRQYQSLGLSGTRADLERAMVLLVEEGSLGFEEIDHPLRLVAYFEDCIQITALQRQLGLAVPNVHVQVHKPLTDRDWHRLWKEHWQGFPVGRNFFITPSWQKPPRTTRQVLKIDPERAFGTGLHHTTRLMLEILENTYRSGSRVIDVGTGTGILAMAAATLGSTSVLGIEPDEEALSCARANVVRNQLKHKVELRHAGWEDIHAAVDLVLANIHFQMLVNALPTFSSWLTRSGSLILSGILSEDVLEIRTSAPSNLRFQKEFSSGEWKALLFQKN